jgi:DNA-binding NarL/FixJ family response regulator
MIPVALVDDHTLLRNALAAHINTIEGYRVILEAGNGKNFIRLLDPENMPGLVLLDILMPEMNGYDTAFWITTHYPQIKIIALSMLEDEAIIGMLQHGAKGYIVKDAETTELRKALDTVANKGIYINQVLYNNILNIINNHLAEDQQAYEKTPPLSEREKEFLQWLCTDRAYKEIASAMQVSPRTVDGYRDSLLAKLKVASRIGLVTFAIRNRIVSI